MRTKQATTGARTQWDFPFRCTVRYGNGSEVIDLYARTHLEALRKLSDVFDAKARRGIHRSPIGVELECGPNGVTFSDWK